MAILVAKKRLYGEKFEDLVAKICHFVINDIMRNGLLGVCHNITRGMEVDGRRQRDGEIRLSLR